MPYPQKAESCSRFSLLCASGEKVISSPAARNVFRFWTNAPENLPDWECKTRKGKSLRRTIWNWLSLRIERTLTASTLRDLRAFVSVSIEPAKSDDIMFIDHRRPHLGEQRFVALNDRCPVYISCDDTTVSTWFLTAWTTVSL